MISILIALVIVGVLLYLLTLIPMDPAIVTIIRVVVILGVVLWIIKALGLHLPF
jgi:hypothetical protein